MPAEASIQSVPDFLDSRLKHAGMTKGRGAIAESAISGSLGPFFAEYGQNPRIMNGTGLMVYWSFPSKSPAGLSREVRAVRESAA